jgi:hypothetical protein
MLAAREAQVTSQRAAAMISLVKIPALPWSRLALAKTRRPIRFVDGRAILLKKANGRAKPQSKIAKIFGKLLCIAKLNGSERDRAGREDGKGKK